MNLSIVSQNAAPVPENQADVDVTIDTDAPTTSVLLAKNTNVPVTPKITTSKRGNRKHSQILSSTPIKYQLEEKQKRQVKR